MTFIRRDGGGSGGSGGSSKFEFVPPPSAKGGGRGPDEIDFSCESQMGKDRGKNQELFSEKREKIQFSLVPRKILTAIARVRVYGNEKYKTSDPDNWKLNKKKDHQEAAFRHFIAYLDDNESVDEDSGLPHIDHLACNIAFLIEGGYKDA